jgi:hypothetical protein
MTAPINNMASRHAPATSRRLLLFADNGRVAAELMLVFAERDPPSFDSLLLLALPAPGDSGTDRA